MKRVLLGSLILLTVIAGGAAAPTADDAGTAPRAPTPGTPAMTPPQTPTPAAHFQALDIIIDASVPLGAYQVEVVVAEGDSTIVGVEGGEPPLDEPPHYDPAALSHNRIILAAFNTTATMPTGRHRVATVHFREVGDEPVYEIILRVAADGDGNRCSASVSIEARKGNQ